MVYVLAEMNYRTYPQHSVISISSSLPAVAAALPRRCAKNVYAGRYPFTQVYQPVIPSETTDILFTLSGVIIGYDGTGAGTGATAGESGKHYWSRPYSLSIELDYHSILSH